MISISYCNCLDREIIKYKIKVKYIIKYKSIKSFNLSFAGNRTFLHLTHKDLFSVSL